MTDTLPAAFDIARLSAAYAAGETDPVQVCGTSGMLFDSSYPTGAYLI